MGLGKFSAFCIEHRQKRSDFRHFWDQTSNFLPAAGEKPAADGDRVFQLVRPCAAVGNHFGKYAFARVALLACHATHAGRMRV